LHTVGNMQAVMWSWKTTVSISVHS